MVQHITITLACGHSHTIPYRWLTAPCVGDRLYCFTCNTRQRVTATVITGPQQQPMPPK